MIKKNFHIYFVSFQVYSVANIEKKILHKKEENAFVMVLSKRCIFMTYPGYENPTHISAACFLCTVFIVYFPILTSQMKSLLLGVICCEYFIV